VQSGNSAEVFSDQNLTQQWKIGRRIIELGVLVEKFYLKFCKSCRLGPVPLTLYSVQKEIKKGTWWISVCAVRKFKLRFY
jgi:hypothetical protein